MSYLTKQDPFHPANFSIPSIFKDSPMFDTLDRFFDRMLANVNPSTTSVLGRDFFEKVSYPKVNIKDYPDKGVLVAAIPGLKKSDIKLGIEDGMLILEGGKSEEYTSGDEENCTYTVRELKSSSFKRRFPIQEDVFEIAKLSAKFEDNVLTVTIPKKEVKPVENAKFKEINIQ